MSNSTEKEPDLSFLFLSPCNPEKGVSEKDYSLAASQLKVEVAVIKTIAEVETTGEAFDSSGCPRILFERHYFHRSTAGKYDTTYPDISNKTAGGYGKFSEQYGKLEKAYKLDANAALSSASWGRFQIMGSNYVAAGFNSVKEFVFAMTKAELEHLRAFVSFVKNDNAMLKDLSDKNWAAFARRYNGPNYTKNNYDSKLNEAYNRFKTT